MIDLNEIESTLKNLKSSIDDYEQEISNIYNEIETVSSWKGNVRDNFINLINGDDLAAKMIISEMSSINEVIKEIYDNYKDIGNKIEFNPTKFNIVNTRIARIETNIDKIFDKYSGLDISFCNSSINSAINSSIKDIRNIDKKVRDSKNNIEKITTEIREKEENIASSISNIEIKNINVTEAMEYVTPKVVGNAGDYILNTNDMESLIEHIENSKMNIEEITSNIENYYGTVIDNYSTKNTRDLNDLFAKIIKEMNKISEIFRNYIIGLGKYLNDIIKVNSKDFMEGVEITNE